MDSQTSSFPRWVNDSRVSASGTSLSYSDLWRGFCQFLVWHVTVSLLVLAVSVRPLLAQGRSVQTNGQSLSGETKKSASATFVTLSCCCYLLLGHLACLRVLHSSLWKLRGVGLT